MTNFPRLLKILKVIQRGPRLSISRTTVNVITYLQIAFCRLLESTPEGLLGLKQHTATTSET